MRRAALALCTLLFALAPAFAGDSPSVVFGDRVIAVRNVAAPFASLDLDGDGKPDSVYVVAVHAAATGTLNPATVVVSGLWNGKPLGAHAAPHALAILLSKGMRRFLVTDVEPDMSGYFDTPIWQQNPPPVSVAKKGTRAFADFKELEPGIRNDILVLGTEAGIDTALYWNGAKLVLFEPAEEP